MLYLREFEVFEDEGWCLAVPFGLEGGTQGEDFREVCEMAADWLRCEAEYRLICGEGMPEPTFGNEPRRGGRVVVVGVEARLDAVRRVTATEAARMLGVAPASVERMLGEDLLTGWREGDVTWVTVDSVVARATDRLGVDVDVTGRDIEGSRRVKHGWDDGEGDPYV